MFPIPNDESYPSSTQNLFVPVIKSKQTTSLKFTKNFNLAKTQNGRYYKRLIIC